MVAGLATAGFGASAEADLKALEQQWIEAYVKGDAAFIKTVEADDYFVIEPDGTVTTKAEDVKSVTDKKFVLKSGSMTEIKVRMLGDNHACVTGLLKMSGTDDGKEFSGDYRGMDVFEKKDGKWQAVASQITKVKKE
jgi:ketosteroid isomerase-like protein